MEMPVKIAEILAKAGSCRTTSPIDPYALDCNKAQRMNEMEGHLTGFDCPICKNKGSIWIADRDKGLFTRECECMVQRRNFQRIERSGLKDTLQRYRFDTWQTPDRWQEKAKALAEKYVEERRGWFVAYGHVGSGKTHLCTAICGELLNAGLNTQYMLWRDVATQAKAVITDDAAYDGIVSPLKKVRVLYIDDLFKTGKGQAPTVGDVNLAFEVLNSRYNDSGKLTIISTERSMEDLLDIDEAVGSRIYERSKGYRLDFSDKPNWRLRE